MFVAPTPRSSISYMLITVGCTPSSNPGIIRRELALLYEDFKSTLLQLESRNAEVLYHERGIVRLLGRHVQSSGRCDKVMEMLEENYKGIDAKLKAGEFAHYLEYEKQMRNFEEFFL